MWQAIPEVLAAFEADPAIRVVVFTGAGDKAFVSGADISQFEPSSAPTARPTRSIAPQSAAANGAMVRLTQSRPSP